MPLACVDICVRRGHAGASGDDRFQPRRLATTLEPNPASPSARSTTDQLSSSAHPATLNNRWPSGHEVSLVKGITSPARSPSSDIAGRFSRLWVHCAVHLEATDLATDAAHLTGLRTVEGALRGSSRSRMAAAPPLEWFTCTTLPNYESVETRNPTPQGRSSGLIRQWKGVPKVDYSNQLMVCYTHRQQRLCPEFGVSAN